MSKIAQLIAELKECVELNDNTANTNFHEAILLMQKAARALELLTAELTEFEIVTLYGCEIYDLAFPDGKGLQDYLRRETEWFISPNDLRDIINQHISARLKEVENAI